MKWKEYHYSSHSGRNGITYRPLLDIEVSSEVDSGAFKALLDSGTEVTMMSAEIADILNISSIGRIWGKAAGVGGERPGFSAPVTIVVPEFPSEVITTNVFFINDTSQNLPFDILLGQDDFFRRFFVKFKKSNNKFFLEVAH